MTESCSHTGWTAERGEKWLRQLARMEAMLAAVDEPLIRALRLDAPCRIAEVGCGGGGTSLELVRRAPAGSVVREVVAEIISLPPFDFDAPGPFRYSTPDKLLLLLEQAGFGELEVSDWRGTLPMGGELPAAEAAAFALASFSSFAEMLAEAADRALGHAKELLAERLAAHHRDGAVRMEACVHIITGAKKGAAGANQA